MVEWWLCQIIKSSLLQYLNFKFFIIFNSYIFILIFEVHIWTIKQSHYFPGKSWNTARRSASSGTAESPRNWSTNWNTFKSFGWSRYEIQYQPKLAFNKMWCVCNVYSIDSNLTWSLEGQIKLCNFKHEGQLENEFYLVCHKASRLLPLLWRLSYLQKMTSY